MKQVLTYVAIGIVSGIIGAAIASACVTARLVGWRETLIYGILRDDERLFQAYKHKSENR